MRRNVMRRKKRIKSAIIKKAKKPKNCKRKKS